MSSHICHRLVFHQTSFQNILLPIAARFWRGSWLLTLKRRARLVWTAPFPHTPQTGDQIPVTRSLREPLWTLKQTTSSWFLLRLPSTFMLPTPRENKILLYRCCYQFIYKPFCSTPFFRRWVIDRIRHFMNQLNLIKLNESFHNRIW